LRLEDMKTGGLTAGASRILPEVPAWMRLPEPQA
jgi:hypothetical protein